MGTALRAFAHPILILWLLVHPALADKLDDVRARGKLVVGVAEASPPFSFRETVSESGPRGGHVLHTKNDANIVGYDVDLAAQVAKRLGVALEKVSIINAERISSLRDGKVDIVAMGMTRTPTRAKDIDFSVATLVSPHKILVRRDSGITKLTQLAGRTLALVRSASVDKALKDAMPTLQIVLFDDYQACFTALKERRVDSFLADELLLLRFAAQGEAPRDFALIEGYELPRTAGFGLKKDEPRFTAIVNQTLLDLEASGAAAKIFDTWFAPLKRPFVIKPD
ncbi:MAG TPA: transporter substrate-binding domain-containing protein [Xanthobacteraceae bacterium]|nr:transporter substrate-binding domain-containing protein [Xanthobacteraceae bacterium]